MDYEPIAAVSLPKTPSGSNLSEWLTWALNAAGVLVTFAINWLNKNAMYVAMMFGLAVIAEVFRVRLTLGGGRK